MSREEFELPKDLTVAARTESCHLSRNLESKVKYFLSFFNRKCVLKCAGLKTKNDF